MSHGMLHVASLSPNSFARFFQRRVFITTVVGLAAIGCQRRTNEAGQAPAALSSATLTDQDGKTHHFAEFEGKSVVLSFFFASCPSVCPRETRALADVQRRLSPALRGRVQFLSLTVDPDNDTPDKLKTFARENAADLQTWSFVRATASATTALAKELAVFSGPGQAEAAPVGHGTSVYLFDGRGHLKQRYAGSPLDVPRLAREIEQLDDWFHNQPSEQSTARL